MFFIVSIEYTFVAVSLHLLHHPEQDKDHRNQGGLVWSDGVSELSRLQPGPLAGSGTISTT